MTPNAAFLGAQVGAEIGAQVSRSLLHTGSQTTQPSGRGLSREGLEFLLAATTFTSAFAIIEYLAYHGYPVFYLLWPFRCCGLVVFYWTWDSIRLYYEDFHNRRKHRWQPGCSSYARPPCPGARAMKEWRTQAPQDAAHSAPLDFDHVQLYLLDFLWCRLFVALPFGLGVVWTILTFRKFRAQFTRVYLTRWLEKHGLIKPLDLPSPGDTFAKMMLNTSLATYYQGPLEHKEDGSVVGRWVIEKAFIPTRGGKNEYGRFEAEIDVANGKFLWATYTPEVGPDGAAVSEAAIEMSAADALVMVMGELFVHIHPQMHAWANFGVSTYSSNAFVARMSKITVMYNHMGNKGAPAYYEFFYKLGLTEFVNYQCFHGEKRHYEHGEQRKGFVARVQQHQDSHSQIYDLMKHSEFVKFIVQVRSKFFREFRKYEETDFKGIHPEGLFLATVMHSLDHEQIFINDVHELRCTNKRFEGLEELMVFGHQVADGFHHFPFAYQFRDAPHPFYQDIYKYAFKLNPEWADMMDACIIR